MQSKTAKFDLCKITKQFNHFLKGGGAGGINLTKNPKKEGDRKIAEG